MFDHCCPCVLLLTFLTTWCMALVSFVLDEVPFYATADERIIEIQGDSLKVLKALEVIVGHLRKFLVDHSVIPLFEKTVSLLLPFFCPFYFPNCKALMLVMEYSANVSFYIFFSL